MGGRYDQARHAPAPRGTGLLWAGLLVASVACNLLLGLGLVWCNIEQVDIAYQLKKLQDTLAERQTHARKLGLERDNLLSPYRLNRKAEEFGMAPARGSQIRRLE